MQEEYIQAEKPIQEALTKEEQEQLMALLKKSRQVLTDSRKGGTLS